MASVRYPTRGTGRLGSAVLRAQLDTLAAQETRRVRIIEPPAAPPAWVSESAFQQIVCDLAGWCEWSVWHDQDSRKNDRGLPDLLLMRGRRLLWRELKTERGKLRPAQLAFGQRLLRAGQDWQCWRPSDWQDIVATLTAEED